MFEREIEGVAQFRPSPMNDHVPEVSGVVAKKVGRYVAPEPTVDMLTILYSMSDQQRPFIVKLHTIQIEN